MAKELLKEAIADAKAVREVALQNAKMALEEAFDSKIKNMLSARLAEELDEDVELEEDYVEEEVDTTDEAVDATDEGMSYDEDDKKVDEMSYDEDDKVDEEINLDELMAELEEMSYDEDEKSEGMKYDEDDMKEEEVEEGIGAKLAGGAKAIGKSLLTYPADVVKEMEAELKKDPKLGDNEKFMAGLKAAKAFAAAAGGAAGALKRDGKGGFSEGKDEDNVEESIDIDALISEIESELEEGKKKEDKEDVKKEVKKAKEALKEALDTVDSLKSTISEMNLLNSKLLYCNKLFRANALTEAQKVKVIDALDKSSTTGEAKLVFETLQESFNFTGVEKRAIQEGLGRASKAAGVAPKKVITESVDETVSRFQKLANINK